MLKQVQWKIPRGKTESLSSVHIYNTKNGVETLCSRFFSFDQAVNDPQGEECKLCKKQRENIKQGKRFIVGDRVTIKKDALNNLPDELRETTWEIIVIFGFKDQATILSETYGKKRDVMLSALRKVENDATRDN
jgi:hypothetical protein